MKNSFNRRALAALSVVLLILPQTIHAQQATPPQPSKRFELTVDSIMRGAALVGYEPTSVRWSQDGTRVYFRWKAATEPRLKEFDTYVVNRNGTNLRKLSEEEAKNAPPASGELSKDKKWTVFADEGDIYLYDHARGVRRQVTRTVETETNPHFTREQTRIYFTRQNNLYLLSLEGGLLEQLTDIRVGGGGGGQRQGGASESQQQRGTESQEVLKKEERELIDAVRERAARREEQEAKRKARERRKPFNIAAGQVVTTLSLSPDGAHVVAIVAEQATAAKQTIVPNYVTESAYTEDIQSRTKVGDAQGRTRMYVLSVETGDARQVEHGQRMTPAPVVRTRTEQNATEQAERERGTPQTQQTQGQQQSQGQTQGQQQGQPPPRTQTESTAQTNTQERERDVQLFQLQWSEDGRNAAMLARSADNKPLGAPARPGDGQNARPRRAARRRVGERPRRVHARLAARQPPRLFRVGGRRLRASLHRLD